LRYFRWYEFWLRLFCSYLILTAGCATNSRTPPPPNTINKRSEKPPQSANKTQENSEKCLLFEMAKQDFGNFPTTLLQNSKDTFLAKDNMIALSLAGGASIIMNQDADDEIAEHYERHRSFRNFKDESLYVIGHPGTHFAIAGIWYALSVENQDRLNPDTINHERSLTMINALFLTWATTGTLKIARNNETPNGESFAWPSGHTSSSFTVASVLDEFYGPKVGIPAYAIASLVGYRMIDTGDHWASDVVFGATLGWIVGHTVAGKHKELEIAGFKILPYIPTGGVPSAGIRLLKQF
jgi:hypothetical protein